MPLQTFLNLLAACLGFFAAMFFVVGVAHLTAQDIKKIASSGWGGLSQNLADSIANQRAEYISGATLLVLSFFLQVAANVVAPTVQPAALQPFGSAIASIVALSAGFLVLAVIFRNVVAKSTKSKVHALFAKDSESQNDDR